MVKKKLLKSNFRGFATVSIKSKTREVLNDKELKTDNSKVNVQLSEDRDTKVNLHNNRDGISFETIADPSTLNIATLVHQANRLSRATLKHLDQVSKITDKINLTSSLDIKLDFEKYNKLTAWCYSNYDNITRYFSQTVNPYKVRNTDKITFVYNKWIKTLYKAYTYAIQLGFLPLQIKASILNLALNDDISVLIDHIIFSSHTEDGIPLEFKDPDEYKDNDHKGSEFGINIPELSSDHKSSDLLSELDHHNIVFDSTFPFTPIDSYSKKSQTNQFFDLEASNDFTFNQFMKTGEEVEDYKLDARVNERYAQALQDLSILQSLKDQAIGQNLNVYFIPNIDNRLLELREEMDRMEGGLLFNQKDVDWIKTELKGKRLLRLRQLKDTVLLGWDNEVFDLVVAMRFGAELEDVELTESNDDDEILVLDDLFQPDSSEEEPKFKPEIPEISRFNFEISLQIPPTWTGQSPKQILISLSKNKGVILTFSTCPTTLISTIVFAYQSNQSYLNTAFQSNQPIINDDKAEYNDFVCDTKVQSQDLVSTIALLEMGWLSSFSVLPPNFRTLASYYRDKKLELELEKNNEELIGAYKVVGEVAKGWLAQFKQSELTKELEFEVKINLSLKQINLGKDYWSNQKTNLKQQFFKKKFDPTYKSIQTTRSQLPITQYKKKILNHINPNHTNPSKSYNPSDQILLVVGETGCGKTTQVPQFLVEHAIEMEKVDKCNVLCTQPRRISAISIAERVSQELGDGIDKLGRDGSLVGYQVRLASKTNPSNLLTFCTMGVLLRRLEQDPKLLTLTHLVIDEIQERSLESDFLLAVVKRILSEPTHLKVILMSATIDQATFSEYFFNCPVLTVPGRTFPVEVKYLEDVVRSTGYVIDKESRYAVRENMRKEVGGKGSREEKKGTFFEDTELMYLENNMTDPIMMTLASMRNDLINYDFICHIIKYICTTSDPFIPKGAILVFLPGISEIKYLNQILKTTLSSIKNVRILQAHSAIPSEKQKEIFIVLNRLRKVVLATNIAETGITIPDVTIVLDTGKMKQVGFDKKMNVCHLNEVWVSKANAKQRSGRAGRVQQGLCFRLFSENRFNKMINYQIPEILRLPLNELCLNVKFYVHKTIKTFLTTCINPPTNFQIDTSITILKEIGALDHNEDLTPLGCQLARLPVNMKLGKLMIFSSRLKCLDAGLSIAAFLSYKSPLSNSLEASTKIDPQVEFLRGNCDFLTMYQAYRGWRSSMNKGGLIKAMMFCYENGLSHQILVEIEFIKAQLLRVLGEAEVIDTSNDGFKEKVHPDIVKIPSRYTKYDDNDGIVKLALMTGLYPNLLVRTNFTLTKPTPSNIPSTPDYFDLSILLANQSGVSTKAHVTLNNNSALSKLLKINSFNIGPQPYPDLTIAIYYELMKTNTKLSTRQISLMTPLQFIFASKYYAPIYHQKVVLLDQGIVIKIPPKLAQCLGLLRKGVKNILNGFNDDVDILELTANLLTRLFI